MAIRCSSLLLRIVCLLSVQLAGTAGHKKHVFSASGWTPFGQREFLFFAIGKTWEEAESTCVEYGGHLASVHSENEEAFINRLIFTQAGYDRPSWLGGYNSHMVPRRWFWTDGSPFDFSVWTPGEPDGFGHCLQTSYNGGWDDFLCNQNIPFVCARQISKGAYSAVGRDAQLHPAVEVEEQPWLSVKLSELRGINSGETVLYCRSDKDSLRKIHEKLHPGDVIVATKLPGHGTELKVIEEDKNRKSKLLAIFRELSNTALQPFCADLSWQNKLNSSIYKVIERAKSEAKGTTRGILTAFQTIHMMTLSHAEKIRNPTKAGTILDIRVLSETTGTKVVILTEDSHGKLTKMQELNPSTKPASQTVTLIYRPKSAQYPDGHHNVLINYQRV
ncbi:hypothetical protein MHYP_G00264070 [Metynnis hypsauchen]